MAALDPSQIPMSADFSATLERASAIAAGHSTGNVSLECLLSALCDDADAIALFSESAINIQGLKSDVAGRMADAAANPSPAKASGLSEDVRRILDAAWAAAKGSRRRDINGAIVVAAIVGDARNVGAEILKAQGLTFEVAIRALQATLSRPKAAGSSQPTNSPEVDAPPPAQIAAPAPEPETATEPSAPVADPEPPSPSLDTPSNAIHSDEGAAPAAASEAKKGAENATGPDTAPTNPGESEGIAAPSPSQFPPPTAAPPFPSAPALRPMPAPASGPSFPTPPFSPYPASPSRDVPFPFPSRPGLAPNPPRTEGAGYGLPARPMPAPGIGAGPSFGSTDILSNIARSRPRPTGAQPPPIPPAIGGPAAPTPRARAPAPTPTPSVNPSLQPTLRQEPSFHHPAPAPIPAPQAAAPSRPSVAKRKAAKVEPGQLAENIPRAMRVGRTERAEIRIAKASVKALTEGLEGDGPAWHHAIAVTKAMAVRMRAPEGGFFIESASPETQWIENNLGFASDDFASWRFLITPQSRGWSRLQIIVSARTVGADGAAAETALPDQVVEVKVRRNLGRSFMKLMGWTVAAIVGGALATFGEMGMEFAKHYAQKFIH